jgi:hypothetical protein
MTRPRTLLAAVAAVAALAVTAPAPATPAPSPPEAVPTIAGCPVFGPDNHWNRRVDRLPVARDSATLIRAIGLDAPLHPDFSDRGGYGIPITVVTSATPRTRVRFRYASESDRVPYPIPRRPRVERGSDRHVLLVDRTRCRLYELFAAERRGGRWHAGSGAVWDLRSDRLRPAGWTSADAAGLPILPGLARYEEVRAGEIRHALRFTAPRTRRAYVYPARHHAGASGDRSLPPMGLRVRLKASVDVSRFPPQARVVLRALQRYGMILADNGSPWYVTGAPSPGWDDDDLHSLHRLSGRHFEVVDTRRLPRP